MLSETDIGDCDSVAAESASSYLQGPQPLIACRRMPDKREVAFDTDYETLLLFETASKAQLSSGAYQIDLNASTLLYLQSGLAHQLSFSSNQSLCVLFIDKVWFHNVLKLYKTAPESDAPVQFSRHLDYPSIARSLRRHLERPECPDGSFLDITARSLLIRHLARQHLSGSNQRPAEQMSDKISELLEDIDDRLPEKITIGALARSLDMTPTQFSRVFRKMLGVSPQAYVIERRVEHARRLIDEGNMTLAEIAFEAGFSSQAHLTVMFSRHAGETPGAYQKQLTH
ncbi:MAG: AraC family transcriptional regulator [Pseudomonadota bacterium]